ncbi:MAG TPA: GxxExxY protein [Abditibacterium sp.]|jgi:GxxExxY protein
MRLNILSGEVIDAAMDVHREIGPGLLESAYEECLCYELTERGIKFRRQVELPVRYKSVNLNCGYRLDIVIEDLIILELKAVASLEPIHTAQILTYLRLSGLSLGFLLNFNVPLLKDGVKRLVYNPHAANFEW